MMLLKGVAVMRQTAEGPIPWEGPVNAIKCLHEAQAMALADLVGEKDCWH